MRKKTTTRIGPYSQEMVEEALSRQRGAIESILNNHNEVNLESLHALVEVGSVLEGIAVHTRLQQRDRTTKRIPPKTHRK